MVIMQIGNVRYNSSHRSSSSITFRIEEEYLKKLRDESQKQGVSLNSYVNQILKSYLEWHMFEPKVGLVPILKPVVEQLFTKLGKEQVIKLQQILVRKKYRILFTL